MKYQINEFGGILLEIENGNIAINSGTSVAALEKAYIINGKTPAAMIVTCEHSHRSKNAVEFCVKHHISLLCTKYCAEVLKLEAEKNSWYDLRNDKTRQKYGLKASLLPVKYDSIDPFVLKISDGDMQYVFVFDGKITPENAEAIFSCDKIILQMEQQFPMQSCGMTISTPLSFRIVFQKSMNSGFHSGLCAVAGETMIFRSGLKFFTTDEKFL